MLEQLIEKLVAQELETLLERKRAKPQIMYHGTMSAVLPKIYQLGMIPNPKKGKWKGEDAFKSATINNPSLHSLEGSYWTSNLGLAYSAASDAMRSLGGEDRHMIVVAQLMPQSAKADEDDVRPKILEGFRTAYSKYFGNREPGDAAPMILAATEVDPSIYVDMINEFARFVHDRLKTGDKMPLDIDFFRPVFHATLNRLLGYLDLSEGPALRSYTETYEYYLGKKTGDYSKAREEAGALYSKLSGKGMPEFNKVSGEKEFLKALDKVSSRYRKTTFPSDAFSPTLRMTEPVGFSGRNKIIAIVLGSGQKLDVVYGKVPEKFIKDYADFWGPKFTIVNTRTGKEIHKPKLEESANADRRIQEKLALKSYKNFCELVSDAYDELPDYDPEAVASYKALIQHVEKMYKRMLSKVKVEFVEGQPYNSQKEMSDKVKETGVLQISTDFNEHDVFTPEQNLKLRAVHDYIVHILSGVDFSDKGEVAAFNAHARLLPPKAIPAAFTEIVGQACYANARGKFPKQKIAIMKGFDFKNVGKVKGYEVQKKELVKGGDDHREIDESPETRAAFADDLQKVGGQYSKNFDKYEKRWGRNIYSTEDKVAEGRPVKQLFHKHADHQWLSTLTTVHWFKHSHGLIDLLEKVTSKDELSTAAYEPGQLKLSYWGKFGLVVKGRITLLANNMDHLYTGHGKAYKEKMPKRAQSSGANKGVGVIFPPETHKEKPLLVFDKDDWEDNRKNEALVDNWKSLAVIYSDPELKEEILQQLKRKGLKLPVLSFEEAKEIF